jgi:two-component system response regulator HydG
VNAPRKLLYVSSGPCPAGLQEHLTRRSWDVVHARHLKAARALLKQQTFFVALLVLDPAMRDVPADLEACRETNDLCEWVALVPPGALDQPALRELVLRHCFDHHTDPADPAFLTQSLGHAFGRAVLRGGAAPDAGAAEELGLVGRSAAVMQLRRLVRRAASADAPVLIEGESGTGKEQVARAVHASSARSGGPFVVLHCGTLAGEPRDLFGNAAGGTLVLDHIAEMPLEWQARLLRFMAENATLRAKLGRDCTSDARIIATADTPLAEAVAAKRFRQDLFFRLNVLLISVPPLRQRADDIGPLAQHFHAQCVRSSGSRAKGFTQQALAALREHTWPGNVTELFNRVQAAVLLADRRLIGPADLGLSQQLPQRMESLEAIRVQAERNAIALSLDRYAHNVSLAARELGVSRMTMYRLMAKHSITPRSSP